MEDVVYPPGVQELETVSNMRYLGNYLKGSVSPWRELFAGIRPLNVSSVQPDLVVDLEFGERQILDHLLLGLRDCHLCFFPCFLDARYPVVDVGYVCFAVGLMCLWGKTEY